MIVPNLRRLLRQFTSAALLPALCFLASCGGGTTQKARFTVLTSFYPMYILTVNVAEGVPGVAVTNLTKPFTGCLHDYSLSPGDMERILKSDALVVNGGGMENFLARALAASPKLRVIEAGAGLSPLLSDNGQTNSHFWLSVSNAAVEVQAIASGLSKCDPQNAAAYQSNAAVYRKRLLALDAEIRGSLAPYRGMPVVTFHEAFPYFAREYGIRLAASVEREPGSEPSAAELARTIAAIRSLHVKAVFAEPQYSTRSAETIARETGVALRTLDPVVTGPMDAGAYERAMRSNLSVLLESFR